MWTSLVGNKKAKFSATGNLSVSKCLIFLKEIAAVFDACKIKSVINRTYILEQIAQAHEYVESGRKKGNVIITLADK